MPASVHAYYNRPDEYLADQAVLNGSNHGRELVIGKKKKSDCPRQRSAEMTDRPIFFLGGSSPVRPTGPRRKLRKSWLPEGDTVKMVPAIEKPKKVWKPPKLTALKTSFRLCGGGNKSIVVPVPEEEEEEEASTTSIATDLLDDFSSSKDETASVVVPGPTTTKEPKEAVQEISSNKKKDSYLEELQISGKSTRRSSISKRHSTVNHHAKPTSSIKLPEQTPRLVVKLRNEQATRAGATTTTLKPCSKRTSVKTVPDSASPHSVGHAVEAAKVATTQEEPPEIEGLVGVPQPKEAPRCRASVPEAQSTVEGTDATKKTKSPRRVSFCDVISYAPQKEHDDGDESDGISKCDSSLPDTIVVSTVSLNDDDNDGGDDDGVSPTACCEHQNEQEASADMICDNCVNLRALIAQQTRELEELRREKEALQNELENTKDGYNNLEKQLNAIKEVLLQ